MSGSSAVGPGGGAIHSAAALEQLGAKPALGMAGAGAVDAGQLGLGSAGSAGGAVDSLGAAGSAELAGGHVGEALSHGNGSGGGAAAVSRAGALAAGDMTAALTGGGVGFVQTPHDGQLMIVPSRGNNIDGQVLQAAMVDAQMKGMPPAQAAALALEQQGAVVYQRPWGDWVGALTRVCL
ncbi:MAG TPA: hypothetical protein ENK23_00170 [Sorangium sp.]|nr:hypothetical protein [Sorangium sp.]